jgi:16S rRNA (cytosine967-C5)-methyltransferase
MWRGDLVEQRRPGTKPKAQRQGTAATQGAQVAAERAEAERHPGLLARTAAALVLQDIVAKGHLIEERFSLAAVPNRLQHLDARDRSLTRSIVTSALRRLGTLRMAIAARLEQGLPRQVPELEWTLIVGAAQILLLDIPDHAAVDLAVRAARLERKTAPFAALVNGLLRNIARARDEILASSDPLDHDVPSWLATRWRKTYGEAGARAIAAAIRKEPTLDITVKSDPAGWAAKLGARVLPTGSLRLASHAPIEELEGYASGAWWIQDAGAALPVSLLGARPGQRIADFCAAPGGKSAQIAAAGALLTAIDRSAERLKRLSANFDRLGLAADLIVADATSLKAAPFDSVLVDAPCLGTGTLRRHPDIAWTKKPGDLAALTVLQAKLLDRAVDLTRPGGTIVYCTCSIEPEEGEMQIAALLRRNPDVARKPITPEEVGGLAELINPQGDLRILPSHLADDEPRFSGIDGFFAARLARQG